MPDVLDSFVRYLAGVPFGCRCLPPVTGPRDPVHRLISRPVPAASAVLGGKRTGAIRSQPDVI